MVAAAPKPAAAAVPIPATGELVYACLTHVPLQVDYPAYVTPLHMGSAQAPGQLNLRDIAPEWEPWHATIGGAAGTFALKNWVLQNHPGATQVGICQYRKFLSRARLGVPALNYQVMDLLHRAKLDTAQLADLMHPHGQDFLIGQPGQFKVGEVNYDYLYQYKDVHHVEDFLRFTAAAVELGVLDKNEVHPFFGEKIFFPGGIELGVFPAAFWLKNVSAMELVVRHCVQHHNQPRAGTQTRAWAFCMERLGSWLLLKHLRAARPAGTDWLSGHVGFLNLITEEAGVQYVPGA